MSLPEIRNKAALARFQTAETGFWAKLAETRDEKLVKTYREPEPHAACKGRPIRDLLFSHEECPECAARILRWMNRPGLPSYLRDTAERLIKQYEVCINCYRWRELCACRSFVTKGEVPWHSR